MLFYKQLSRRSFFTMTAAGTIAAGLIQTKPASELPDLERIKQMLRHDQPVIWLFTGDSVTQGAHHTYGYRCYPEIFAEHVRWEMRRVNDFVLNTAINGTNTSYLLKSFERNVAQFKPGVVFLMYGINDCQEPSISVPVFEENLVTILDQIRKTAAIPVLQSPNAIDREGVKKMKTASRESLPVYVKAVRRVAASKQVVFIDHSDNWTKMGLEAYKQWLDDPMHPNAAGHTQMARLIFRQFSIFSDKDFTCTSNTVQ